MTSDISTSAIVGTADAAGTWQLGDRTVNRLGLGAMRLGGMPWEPPRRRDDATAVLRRAVELGVNHIDTAAFYFTAVRSCNELISTALQPYPDDLVLATKVGPSRSRDGEFEPMARPEQLRTQVEENLRDLGVDQMGLVNLRFGVGMDKTAGSVAEHIGALVDLRDAGLLRTIGLSNITADQLTEALSITPVACVQNRYGLTDRGDDDLLELCGEKGVAFVPFFAVATATGASPVDGPDATGEAEITAVADKHGATPAQIRLAWTLQRGPHVLAIPGTGNPAHLEQNVASASLRLDDADLATLDAIAAG
ncbi:oxidoreductase [Gordonia sp. HNM0687]|uniref:Oxidoreductase n=1 Tax=Gordonia mangrovi TaxID=2665643 RepID=A0A6L7GK75_9ACTN|nr:oxidoreductase [Gordonia mangrovi]MXP20319.1 oxidoreductase [Gordonia mangrovi]UVF79080.1 oxidoreductase [Gordonia mangrovi]